MTRQKNRARNTLVRSSSSDRELPAFSFLRPTRYSVPESHSNQPGIAFFYRCRPVLGVCFFKDKIAGGSLVFLVIAIGFKKTLAMNELLRFKRFHKENSRFNDLFFLNPKTLKQLLSAR